MPDITLYQEDIASLHGICLHTKNKLREKGKQQILSEAEYEMINECERLGDLLIDRLTQRLHNYKKEKSDDEIIEEKAEKYWR